MSDTFLTGHREERRAAADAVALLHPTRPPSAAAVLSSKRTEILTAGGWVPVRLTDGCRGLSLSGGEWTTSGLDFTRRLQAGPGLTDGTARYSDA